MKESASSDSISLRYVRYEHVFLGWLIPCKNTEVSFPVSNCSKSPRTRRSNLLPSFHLSSTDMLCDVIQYFTVVLLACDYSCVGDTWCVAGVFTLHLTIPLLTSSPSLHIIFLFPHFILSCTWEIFNNIHPSPTLMMISGRAGSKRKGMFSYSIFFTILKLSSEFTKSHPIIGISVILFVAFSGIVFYSTLKELQRFAQDFVLLNNKFWFFLLTLISQTEHPVSIPWNLEDLKKLNEELGHLQVNKYSTVLLFFCSFYILYVFLYIIFPILYVLNFYCFFIYIIYYILFFL